MLEAHLIQAIEACHRGEVPFNLGEPRSFLYGSCWFPLRGVLNYASGLAGGPNNLTVDRCLLLLHGALPYVRIKDVAFEDHFPVELEQLEIMSEIKSITQVLTQLVQ